MRVRNEVNDGQRVARELFFSYSRGWGHGAHANAPDPKVTEHNRIDIREAYERGYREGRIARSDHMRRAAEQLGYKPEVLRVDQALTTGAKDE